MRWWETVKAELRQVFFSGASPDLSHVYGAVSAAGEPVSLERAAGLSAVWACTSLISGSIASMPLITYRRVEDEGRAKATEHPLFDVLRLRPNPVQSVMAFWEAMVTALLLRGNAYALITKDDDGRVRALWYTSPDRVSVTVTKTGKLVYKVSPPAGAQFTVPDGQMLHITGPMSPDGFMGRSVIRTFADTLGLGLALERYSSEFFSNAATPRGILTTANRLSDTARARLKTVLAENHASPGQRHKTLVLEEGMTWAALGVSAEDSQLIESRAFGVQEVARIFGVPVAMINGDMKTSLTYSNSESRSLDFLKFCLGPWTARIEAAVNFACISPLERKQMYVEFLPDSLLSTDTKSRYEAYAIALSNGILTIDEVRRRENLPALPERITAVG